MILCCDAEVVHRLPHPCSRGARAKLVWLSRSFLFALFTNTRLTAPLNRSSSRATYVRWDLRCKWAKAQPRRARALPLLNNRHLYLLPPTQQQQQAHLLLFLDYTTQLKREIMPPYNNCYPLPPPPTTKPKRVRPRPRRPRSRPTTRMRKVLLHCIGLPSIIISSAANYSSNEGQRWTLWAGI